MVRLYDNDPKKVSSQKWITCASNNEMIDAVRAIIQPDDVVAEIGAQLREVSTRLCQTLETGNGKATLMDVARKAPQNTARDNIDRIKAMRCPGEEKTFFTNVATFHEMKNLEQWRTVLYQASKTYDVLVLDLNNIVGNDLDLSAFAIVKEFDVLFPMYRVIIIKSVSLNQWATRLVHAQKWIDRRGRYDDMIPSPHIVATVGVQEYRNTIPWTVQPGDAVLELGCHLGTSTVLLQKMAGNTGSVLGVDVGPKIIAGARARYPDVDFAVGDAWKTAGLLRIQSGLGHRGRIGYDVCYVDVGGLSGSDGLLEALSLLSALTNALEPRTIVIKSLCVRRLSSRLVPFWQVRKSRQGR